ncbi:hypothetical protein SDC9_146378 [bioreactor metagenome]|uniref:HDOD domain-containing protein n=1 Tax=bioreactor metagenome TaxID=1076179 RepID=A0A645EB31_9ZZZZ
MKSIDIKKVIDRVEAFPTLPTIYTSLLEVTSNPHSTVQDIANVVMQDQAAVIKTLKLVNSPIYGIATRVTTISKSIMFLGVNEIKNIVLALSIIDLFSHSNENINKYMLEVWKHSIAVGVITLILGEILKIGNLEDYFIAGLTHDIGKLFFMTYYVEEYSYLISKVYEENLDLHTVEKETFGLNHDDIGELLSKKRKLPDLMQHSIKFHHKGGMGNNSDKLVACVHLANTIAKCMHLGKSFENEIVQPDYEIWNILNFPVDTSIHLLRDKILAVYQKSISILILNKE